MMNFIAHLVLYTIFFSSRIPNSSALPMQADSAETGPEIINERKLGIKIFAPYAVAMDIDSGKILYEKEKDLQTSLASITKLMTAMVFLENNPGWDKPVIVKKEDIKDGGALTLAPGDKVTVKDLFSLSLIASSNEAANALVGSTGLAMDEFVKKMNLKAKTYGLEYTYFVEPTGLEPANISTAYETAIVAREAFKNKEIRDALKTKSIAVSIIGSKKQVIGKSTDKLLDSFVNDKKQDFEIIGAKTGFIQESLYNFTAEVKKNGHSIIISILGSKTDDYRWAESKGLIDWVFSNFRWPK